MRETVLFCAKLFLFTALLMGLASCVAKGPVTLNISAAASLTDALQEINTLYTARNPNVAIMPNYASSGILQMQIQNGAPVDVFISAAASQMDTLQKAQLIIEDTRRDLLTNKVVLIVPVDSTLGISSFQDLAGDTVKKVALGDPKSVPAGMYGQQALDEFGITSRVQPKLIFSSDVHQILSYVESGNVDAGVVYLTDAKNSDKVKVVANAPDDINARVVYPAAVVKGSRNTEAARDYLNFLFSDSCRAVFEKYGFTPVAR
jgi:molybdate transport system substrate-binding protein